jgi:hypothetical protein
MIYKNQNKVATKYSFRGISGQSVISILGGCLEYSYVDIYINYVCTVYFHVTVLGVILVSE